MMRSKFGELVVLLKIKFTKKIKNILLKFIKNQIKGCKNWKKLKKLRKNLI